MIVKGNFTSLVVLNKKNQDFVLGWWDVSPPMGHVHVLQEVEGQGFAHLLGHGGILFEGQWQRVL